MRKIEVPVPLLGLGVNCSVLEQYFYQWKQGVWQVLLLVLVEPRNSSRAPLLLQQQRS